ncbi:unnamed protein product [Aureobasidium mustum]|uniref:UBA domain-containing protein n=1 Tax=Aureobasidium mustum TaxID=2773714 RepID=A0A9N8JDB3_9PEZI|nr:unnamed protein product [Aureobasidium mustum]
MASTISKRQQARNERMLQDLLKVSGNDRCADCAAKNPVKSLSMDSWSPDQVDNMKRVGNTTSNRTFNPQNVRPDIPTDADEVGGVMERFIRQKYEHKAFVGSRPRSHTVGGASVSSNEGVPPPLPPKPGKKFGFSLGVRSSSATQQRFTPPLSPALTGSDGRSTPPVGKMNKPSRVFGSNVGNQEEESFDTKLASLREMGFPDTRRNSMVLKNVNGNLDKAVETLVRLGDTTSGAQGTLTPMSGSTSSSNANGIYIEKQRAQPEKAASSTNPFDALDLQPPRRAFTQPALSTAAPQPSLPSNPYQVPQSSQPEPYQSYQSAQQQMPQQQQQLYSQPTGRYGKTDIMALYNQPQLAPSRPLQPLPENGMAPAMMPQQQQQQQQVQVPPHMQQAPQRSVTMPVGSGSMNPFGSGFSAPQQDQQARPGARHVSQESKDFVGMGNGRPHSPDAFASLSARYAR